MRGSSLLISFIILLAAVLLSFFALRTLVSERPRDANTHDAELEMLEAPTVDFANPMIGPLNAPVRIVEFGDYQCESCAEFSATITEAIIHYGDLLNYVWKDAPDTTVHPYALSAAAAARCAGDQGAYWAYHEVLFSNPASINDNAYAVFAEQLDLDVEDFSECIAAKRMDPIVRRDREQALLLGVDATPYLFINDVRVSGAPTFDRLRSLIDAELAKKGITPPSPPSEQPSEQPVNERAQENPVTP